MSSRRTEPLPRGWHRTRQRIARRDANTCQLNYRGCWGIVRIGKGAHTDHIIPVSQGGSDEDSNLCHACKNCHDLKTAREANVAKPKRLRPERKHPGLID